MKNEDFDFDLDKYWEELEAIEKEIEALYPIDDSRDYEPYEYLDYFNLLEEEIPANRVNIYEWLEEWFQSYFLDNLERSDAYVLYSEEDGEWEVCIPIHSTEMEGIELTPSGFETDTHRIEFRSDGQYFIGTCSVDILKDLLAVFRIWVERKESKITSYAQYRGYSNKCLMCLKKLAIDSRITTRREAIGMAEIYLDAIQMTTDFHMNLLWQLVIQMLENMSDMMFLKVKAKVCREENDQK